MIGTCRKAVSTAAVLTLLATLGACGREEASNAVDAAPAPAARGEAPASPEAPSPTPEPVFTSLARTNCTLLEEKREEAGYARFMCPGRGDYRLEVVEADGREDLALGRRDGAAKPMQLASQVAKGAFSKLGETAQWVGGERLIVRYDVEQSEGQPAVSSLLVIDLPVACLVAIVPPGPGQNEVAFRAAEELPDCLRDGSGAESEARVLPM